MSTSRSYHHGDLRSALIAATRVLLADKGIEGLSLREVSRRSGVSHAAAYNHFRDKAELLAAVVDAGFAELARGLRAARDGADDSLDGFKRIGVAYVSFAYAHPADFKLMFRPELSSLGGEPGTGSAEGAAYGILVDTVVECQQAGTIAAGPAETPVLAAWSIVHGLAALLVDGPQRNLAPTASAAEDVARRCVDALVTGLQAT